MTPTPQEKAKELVAKYHNTCNATIAGISTIFWSMAKQCAIIAVDEILASFNSFMDSRRNFRHELEIEAENYWQQVKEQIQKL